jgi:hypothetical protein
MLRRISKTHSVLSQLGNNDRNNILISGLPSTGKNYAIDQLFEIGYDKGYIRLIDAWCPEIKYLREAIGLALRSAAAAGERDEPTVPAGLAANTDKAVRQYPTFKE